MNSAVNVAEQIKQSALFKGIAITDLEALAQVMKRQTFPLGTTLFKKGDPGNCLYIILAGQVRIYTEDTQKQEFTLMNYGPGQVFGDFSILDQEPRSASAAVIESLEVMTLTRDDFMAFLPKHPAVGLAMIRHLTDSLRYITVYLNRVTAFGQHLSEGNYEKAIAELSDSKTGDEEIDRLIVSFLQVAQNIQEREQNLST